MTTVGGPVDSGVSRRGFIAFGSAVAATPWLNAPARAAGHDGVATASVGYAGGVDYRAWRRGEPGAALRVLPARAVHSGDRALASARVTIHGLYPSADAGDGVELDVVVADRTTGVRVPVQAWTHRVRPASTAAGVTLPLALDRNDALELALRVAGASGARAYAARFTLGSRADRLNLRSGVYFVGLGAATWLTAATLRSGHDRRDRASVVLSVARAG
ncbi:MAG TPA: hypothetical protein VHJ34_06630 [Actinomycetota bacterium]|nr:hypothetical protein [Actinomycetota bacterium]